MLLSMTGYGDARVETERLSVAAEIRTLNNRYLKVVIRAPDTFAPLEPRIERLVRESLARGSVLVTLRVRSPAATLSSTIDADVLRAYWQRWSRLVTELGCPAPSDPSVLLSLPGVVLDDAAAQADVEADWPPIEQALRQALERLRGFRLEEGRAIRADLEKQCAVVRQRLEEVASRAPMVVEAYRERLLERVRELLRGTDVAVEPADLLREVSLFAERCDINEEIARLRCHLDQFDQVLDEERPQGRKLEFLSQEMVREVNTIGAKANDATIAHAVVDMKAAIDRIRENLQNVE